MHSCILHSLSFSLFITLSETPLINFSPSSTFEQFKMNCSKYLADCGSCIAQNCYYFVLDSGQSTCVLNPATVNGVITLKVDPFVDCPPFTFTTSTPPPPFIYEPPIPPSLMISKYLIIYLFTMKASGESKCMLSKTFDFIWQMPFI